MPSYTRIWHRPLQTTCMLFEGWPHKLLPHSLEEDETQKTKKMEKTKQKKQEILEKTKNNKKYNMSILFGEGGNYTRVRKYVFLGLFCVLLFFVFPIFFWVLVFPMFFVFLPVPMFPACCTVRSTGFAGTMFFRSKECHQKDKTILHLFQGKLHKGMPHCAQGMQWFLQVELLFEEYLFKIMRDFLQWILLLFKWPFHGVILHFLTETSPSFQGIAIHIYEKVPFSTRA